MPEEPAAAPVEDQAPIADTPDTPEAEPAEDTPPAKAEIDWAQRYKEQEKVMARQSAELGLLRKGEQPAADSEAESDEDSEDDDAEPARAEAVTASERFEADSWRLADQLYGADALTAYEAAYRILRVAETPADHIAAFEAYYEVRAGGGKAPADAKADTKAAGKTKAEAVQPRVDANRSDAGPDPSIDKTIEEAKGKGDLLGLVKGARAKWGF